MNNKTKGDRLELFFVWVGVIIMLSSLVLIVFLLIHTKNEIKTQCKNQTLQETVNQYNNYTNVEVNNITKNYYEYIDFPLRHTPKCKGATKTYRGDGINNQPFLEHGEEFNVMLDDWENVTMHDVILYRTNVSNNGGRFAHAVLYLSDNYALTAGYNNKWQDYYRVTPDMYIGRVCR